MALLGAAAVAGFTALLAATARFPRVRWAFMAAAITLGVTVLATDRFFRSWTIFQVALIPFAFRARRGILPLLLLTSACATSRIWLNISPQWYGFVGIVPLY